MPDATRRGGRLPHSLFVGALVFLMACSDRSSSPDLVVAPPAPTLSADIATAIRARIDDGEVAAEHLTKAEQAELRSLYEPMAYAPLWVDASGAHGHSARDALTIL